MANDKVSVIGAHSIIKQRVLDGDNETLKRLKQELKTVDKNTLRGVMLQRRIIKLEKKIERRVGW